MRKLCALLLLLVCAFPLLADPPMTKLRIEVKNNSDKPVDRAAVIVRFLEGRSIVKLGKRTKTQWELRTNQLGMVSIPPIPQGKIRVQVIAKGYQTFGNDFTVEEEEKTLAIKLNPPQQQYTAH